jgi:hypothetical protein
VPVDPSGRFLEARSGGNTAGVLGCMIDQTTGADGECRGLRAG